MLLLSLFLCIQIAAHQTHIKLNGSRQILSPNYPDSIPTQYQADWRIETNKESKIRVTFIEFNIEDSDFCKQSFLTLTESGSENTQESQRICGNDYSNFTTESNQLLISLRVNGGFPDSRFQIFLEEITWVTDHFGSPIVKKTHVNLSKTKVFMPTFPTSTETGTDQTEESSQTSEGFQKSSFLNHKDLLPNVSDRLQKSIEELVEILSQEPTTQPPTTTGLYEKFMRQNRWHSENQFKPTPRLLTRESHEIQQPIEKYEWMFAIAAIFISIVIGAVIIRSYSSDKEGKKSDECQKDFKRNAPEIRPACR